MRIIVVSVYFGKLPDYLNLWIKSCQFNPKINFLLVTDQKLDSYELPQNVKGVFYTLGDMKKRASQILGFDATLHSPYKCCDYKPLYGLIFSDYVNGYDYWGHCDLDMIFGDLNQCFQDNHFEKYHKFLPLGHLSLYKNTDEINNSYKLPGAYIDYRTVYSNKGSYAFDEMDGMAAIFYKNNIPFFDKRLFADIDKKHKRFRLSEYCVPKHQRNNYKMQLFYWENGKVFRKSFRKNQEVVDEFCYIHFQKRHNMRVNDVTPDSSAFYITDSGFFNKTSEATIETVNEMNPYVSAFYEWTENQVDAMKHIIMRLKRGFARLSKR